MNEKQEALNFLSSLDRKESPKKENENLIKLVQSLKEHKMDTKPDPIFQVKLKNELEQNYYPKQKSLFGNLKLYYLGATITMIFAIGLGTFLILNKDNNSNSNKVAQRSSWAKLSYAKGTVEKKTGDNSWTKLQQEDAVKENDEVRTLTGAWATFETENGSIIRLDESTRIAFEKLNTGEITLNQHEGSSYNRVKEGTKYLVIADNAKFEAIGTAFTVKNNDKNAESLIIQSKVKITCTDEEKEAEEGKKAIIDFEKDKDKINIGEIVKEELETPFLKWNRQEDEKGKFALGQLE